ncbi:hypothetical protein [Streptomyces roseicoloratus]|uniref:Protein kinase domain-containing protein n=1 Tax=Streptomyces roseicoloratus TaxID=2508722 RepID=A0ABY9RRS8_9ACTN|nr:hypothetical protein [Streptomyces roseicoloratus]WMX44898.1 hypothetical protein RGF97_08580 [Streptomyces roseicoloratus]
MTTTDDTPDSASDDGDGAVPDHVDLTLGDGTPITRKGRPLGTGGQGSVWALAERTHLAGKIYDRSPDAAQLRRLTAMLRADPLAGERLTPGQPPMLAWPLQLIETGGRTVGYAMPFLDPANHVQLSGLLQKRERLRRYGGRAHWRFLLGVASNLAYMTAQLHERNVLAGDLSSANAVADQRGFVTLLDCDSFAFTDSLTGEFFGSDVFTDDCAGPERHSGGPATRHSDDFALAVLVYQLLTAGNHPYDGTPRQGPAESTRKDNILAGSSFLVCPDRMRVPDRQLPVRWLPPEVARLARQAFGPGWREPARRPSSAEWLQALDEAKESVVECRTVPAHHYGGHLTSCPWCAHAANGHHDPFVAGPGGAGRSGRGTGSSRTASTSPTASSTASSSRASSSRASSSASAASAASSKPAATPSSKATTKPTAAKAASQPTARTTATPKNAPPTAPQATTAKTSTPKATPAGGTANAARKATGSGSAGSSEAAAGARETPPPLTKGDIALGLTFLAIVLGVLIGVVWGVIALIQALIS